MKKIALATLVAGGLAAALLGAAAPAVAATPSDAGLTVPSAVDVKSGIDRLHWLDKIQPEVTVPDVDTTVRQSR